MTQMADPQVFLESPGTTLGEGPVWLADRDALAWVDILGRRVHVTAADGSDREYPTQLTVGAAVPHVDGGLVLCTGTGLLRLDLDADHDVSDPGITLFAGDPEEVRCNDAKADPHGRLFAGTMRFDEADGGGALYRVDPGATEPVEIVPATTVSNGMDWTADERWMYYIDTPTQTVVRFAYDGATGAIDGRETFVDTSALSGFPDGMTLDGEGNLWVAFWEGSAVRCFSGADGSLLEELTLPASRVTACAFGGADLATLYVTTARVGLSGPEEEPLAGSVFSLRPGVAGRPANRARI
jgi:sugar lactone lactonase YvrE